MLLRLSKPYVDPLGEDMWKAFHMWMEKQNGQNCKIAIGAHLIKQTLISKPIYLSRKYWRMIYFFPHVCDKLMKENKEKYFAMRWKVEG
jgi:hypothetical protein